MEKTTVSTIMLALLLTSMLTLAFNIQPAKAASETIIDTHGDSRFTKYPSGPYWWSVADHDVFHTRAYNNNFWYTYCGAEGQGELYFGMWQASLPQSGAYEVFVWIPDPDAFGTYTPTQSAIYQIYHRDGMAVRTVNQRLRTGGWYSLGSYPFSSSASVILNDRTGEPYLSTMIAFDAVKFVTTSPINQPFTLNSGYVSPSSGDTLTTFSYYVTYSDPEGDVPTLKYVYIDGSPHTMVKISGDYVPGAVFRYSTTLSVGWDHNYYFYFEDSVHGHTKRLPTPGTYPGPNVPPPDFSITSSPTSLTIQKGSSGTSTITITSINGFNNLVELARSGMPSGVTASLSHQFVAPPAGGSETSTLTVTVDGTASLGSYSLTVTGTSGALDHSTYISLEVTAAPPPPNQLPNKPTAVSQCKSDGATVIPEGGTTPESTVVFKATVSDPDGDLVKLEIELRQTGEPFTGGPTAETISDFVPSGSQVTITRTGLWNADYHWRFRAKDLKEAVSDWTEFGVSGNADFTILAGSDPHIDSLDPSSGAVGIPLTIKGTNFGQKSSIDVAFGTTPDDFAPKYAEIISANEAEIVVIVPKGSGVAYVWVDVQVNLFTWKYSNKVSFTYERPIIRTFSPSSGIPESQVAIEGEHFGARAGETDAATWVKFGRSFAEIVSWEDTRIVVKAPPDYGTGLDDFERTVALLKMGLHISSGGATLVVDLIAEMFAIPDIEDLFIPEVEDVSDLDGVAIGVRVGTYAGISDSAFWTYEFDSAIISGGWCPIEFRVYNNQGNISGLVNGEKKSEIPYSHSFGNSVIVFSANESYHYQAVGQDIGKYNLTIALITSDGNATFAAIDIPTSYNVMHQYSIDWDALSQGGEGVTVQVDPNGDGVFEYTFTSDSELTRSEFLAQTGLPALFFEIVWGEETFIVSVESNSTVSKFAFNQPDKEISFSVTGLDGPIGFCNVTIPKALLYAAPGDWIVLIDGASVSPIITENSTHSCLYFTYAHSTHEVQIIGTWVIGPPPPPLSVSISPLSASILVDQSVTFTSTVSGGYTPYSYQWYLNGAPVSGATSASWMFTPTTSGIYYVHLKVTDAKANTAQSETARMTVAAVPVGGYSFPIQVHTKTEPVLPYIALIATLTAVFTKLRPKTKRKR